MEDQDRPDKSKKKHGLDGSKTLPGEPCLSLEQKKSFAFLSTASFSFSLPACCSGKSERSCSPSCSRKASEKRLRRQSSEKKVFLLLLPRGKRALNDAISKAAAAAAAATPSPLSLFLSVSFSFHAGFFHFASIPLLGGGGGGGRRGEEAVFRLHILFLDSSFRQDKEGAHARNHPKARETRKNVKKKVFVLHAATSE